MNGDVTLNVILACLKCRVLCEGESYHDYVRSPDPFLCPDCEGEAWAARFEERKVKADEG